jgi:hypothetical protein
VTAGFTLDIAGLAVALTADDDLPIAAEGSARKFVRPVGVAGPAPLARIHAAWGDPAVPAAAPLIFDSGKGLWRLFGTAEGRTFVFTSPMLGPAPYQTATFSDDFRSGRVTLRRASFAERLPIYPLHYPLDEVFMVHLLAQGLGVEIHGGGAVLPDGRGWLFVGQSGAGKTTLSRLWRDEPGVTLLSDERIILRGEADGVWMYGTPWHGDGHISSPGRARLDRIFFLRHGARNELHAVAPTGVVARLFACGFTPFHDAAGLDFTLELLGEIARRCRCEELGFVPDRSAVAFALAS